MKRLQSLLFSLRTRLALFRAGPTRGYICRTFYTLRKEILEELLLKTHLNSPTDVAEFFGARNIRDILNGFRHATNEQVLELYAKYPRLPVNLWYLTEPNEINGAFLSWTVCVWGEILFSLGIRYNVRVARPHETEVTPVILRVGLAWPGRELESFPLPQGREYLLTIPRSEDSDIITAKVLEPYLFEIWFCSVRFGIREKEVYYVGQLLPRSQNASPRHISFTWQSALEDEPETNEPSTSLEDTGGAPSA